MIKNYCKVTNAKVSGNKDTTNTSQMSLGIYLHLLLKMCDYDLSEYGDRNTQYFAMGISNSRLTYFLQWWIQEAYTLTKDIRMEAAKNISNKQGLDT